MQGKTLFLLGVMAFSAVIYSCAEDPECTQEIPYDRIIITFYDKNEFEPEAAEFNIITNSDTILHVDLDSAQEFDAVQLQLNPNSDTSRFTFLTGARTYHVEVSYTRELQWLSAECGPNFFFDNLSVISHTFDSANTVNSSIDASINENIRLYN